MGTIAEDGVWLPLVTVCRHERRGEFKLIRYGAREDSGMSFVVGNLIPVASNVMATQGLSLVLEGLDSFQVCPAKTKLESEIGVMQPRLLSKFVREHKFVDVLRRDRHSLCITPSHRAGRGWKGITAYIQEEAEIAMPATQEEFFRALMLAFDSAT